MRLRLQYVLCITIAAYTATTVYHQDGLATNDPAQIEDLLRNIRELQSKQPYEYEAVRNPCLIPTILQEFNEAAAEDARPIIQQEWMKEYGGMREYWNRLKNQLDANQGIFITQLPRLVRFTNDIIKAISDAQAAVVVDDSSSEASNETEPPQNEQNTAQPDIEPLDFLAEYKWFVMYNVAYHANQLALDGSVLSGRWADYPDLLDRLNPVLAGLICKKVDSLHKELRQLPLTRLEDVIKLVATISDDSCLLAAILDADADAFPDTLQRYLYNGLFSGSHKEAARVFESVAESISWTRATEDDIDCSSDYCTRLAHVPMYIYSLTNWDLFEELFGQIMDRLAYLNIKPLSNYDRFKEFWIYLSTSLYYNIYANDDKTLSHYLKMLEIILWDISPGVYNDPDFAEHIDKYAEEAGAAVTIFATYLLPAYKGQLSLQN